jgi:hypothetical protein
MKLDGNVSSSVNSKSLQNKHIEVMRTKVKHYIAMNAAFITAKLKMDLIM